MGQAKRSLLVKKQLDSSSGFDGQYRLVADGQRTDRASISSRSNNATTPTAVNTLNKSVWVLSYVSRKNDRIRRAAWSALAANPEGIEFRTTAVSTFRNRTMIAPEYAATDLQRTADDITGNYIGRLRRHAT